MNDIRIISVREQPDYLDRAADYFSSTWGLSRDLYYDCISNSLSTDSPLPRWYLMQKEDEIIGSYGLIVNDFVSRQDLWPWLCALYVEESRRGKALGARLLEHGRREAAKLGFSALYLFTDHIGYYEKYGWRFFAPGYDISGETSRIYVADSIEA